MQRKIRSFPTSFSSFSLRYHQAVRTLEKTGHLSMTEIREGLGSERMIPESPTEIQTETLDLLVNLPMGRIDKHK
jgi:hypothetical protein